MKADISELAKLLGASETMFDILVCKPADLPDTVTVIGPEDIDRGFQSAFPERLGAFPTHKVNRLLQRAAGRIGHRLARRAADQLDVAPGGLKHAWFFPILAELTSLVPIRHLARQYARSDQEQPFAIVLPSQSFVCLNAWDTNFVEPLYLASEMRRCGASVCLIAEDDFDPPALAFRLSDKWLPKGYPRFFRSPDFETVLCKNAIRSSDVVAQETGAKIRKTPGMVSRLKINSLRRKNCRFEVPLTQGPRMAGFPIYSVEKSAISIEQAFDDLLGPLTRQVRDWYRSELEGRPVRMAQVADHASLEGGLLGAEVVRRGGQIRIWPHSANVVHMEAHDPAQVAGITVAAQSTGAHWAKKFGAEKLRVATKTILPDAPPASAFDEKQSIHVVLFGGAHFLRRVPLISYQAHEQSWTNTLNALLKSDVSFVVKHKSVWETRNWITQRAPNNTKLRFSNVHANKLQLPNMVFVCISLASTAILEGIARGVPGVIVRDVAVDETPHYDPASVPTLRSDQLGPFLAGLRSKAAWLELRERQRTWFLRETGQ